MCMQGLAQAEIRTNSSTSIRSSSSTGGTCRVKREWSSVTVTAVVAFFFGYGGLNVGYLRVRRASGQGKVDEVRPFPRSSKASSVCACVRAEPRPGKVVQSKARSGQVKEGYVRDRGADSTRLAQGRFGTTGGKGVEGQEWGVREGGA